MTRVAAVVLGRFSLRKREGGWESFQSDRKGTCDRESAACPSQPPAPFTTGCFCNAAHIDLTPAVCTVALKKNRNLPALLEAFQAVGPGRIPWLGNPRSVFQGASTS